VNPAFPAALASWNITLPTTAVLLLVAWIYVRGWRRARSFIHHESDSSRLIAFLAGVATLFVALESPLDSFDSIYLAAHMTQHLLLMMVAPPLVLLGHPVLPILQGLPKPFVKEALGPFLTWRPLRRFFSWLTSPPVAWGAFVASTIGWHLPWSYELALRSPFWHGIQHASFFWTGVLFWWFVIEPGPGKSHWPRWVGIPYLLTSDLLNTAISAALVFSGRLFYPSYAVVHVTRAEAMRDQVIGGLIMWVPGEMIYLIPAFFLTMQVVTGPKSLLYRPIVTRRVYERAGGQNLAVMLARWRRPLQFAMLALAVAVTADGILGPQVTPLNLAGVLPWIHWRALSVIALLLVGNLFCFACPFTLVRDLGRKLLPAKLRWPRQLRNKWLASALFLIFLWAYEAFAIWDSPWLTAWIIVGYFVAALVIDGLFRGASFCKYVCPIGQFHFVSSLLSPREVAVKNPQICKSCETYDCIRGNEHTRGCELYLFLPKKAGNLDCTLCMDCVKACPSQNIDLLPVLPGSTLASDAYRSSLGRLSKRTDIAALALLFVFGAFVNAAGMVGPVMMWEHGWHARLGPHAMPFIIAAFVLVGAVVAPAAAVALAGGFSRIARPWVSLSDLARRFAFALIPIGLGMWAAHVFYHLATGWVAAWPAVQRIVAGTATAVALPVVPSWVTPFQLLALNAGLLGTLWLVWKIAAQTTAKLKSVLALMTPWVAVSIALYGAGVWILFQPMQMRGMMH
jgi:cytochrome c oxidase assembly factor CtaG